jgi:hypothetical protein
MIFLSLLDLLLSFTVLLFERLLLIGFLLAILALEYWMLTQGVVSQRIRTIFF